MLTRGCLKIITSLCILASIGVGVYIYFVTKNNCDLIQPLNVHYNNATIVCDTPICAQIGKNILKDFGGNVADAAIASLLCMGVVHSHSSGIGGGFLMVIYNGTTKESVVLNARETAPLAASQNMFNGEEKKSQKGGLSVGVPGELRGLYELFKKHGSGKVSWSQLVAPTIKICQEGYQVDKPHGRCLDQEHENILSEPSMASIFINQETKKVWEVGDWIKRQKLGKTFKIISEFGADALYNSSVHELSTWFLQDLKKLGGIITEQDLLDYRVTWSEALKVPIYDNFTLHTVPPPGSGAVEAFILRLLSEFKLNSNSIKNEEAVKTHHLIIQSFMHAYAERTLLGDPDDPEVTQIVQEVVYNLTKSENYLKSIKKLIMDTKIANNSTEFYGAKFYTPNDHGTAHLSILSQNGDAISVTSTINLIFGAGIRSESTGIILNDELDDFSAPNITNYFGLPPSENNFIRPKKRPLSSMTPSIFTDDDQRVRLVLGSSGGTKITTITSYVAMRNLWFNETLREAIEAPRIHHQLFPMTLRYENEFPNEWLKQLEQLGYNTRLSPKLAATCGIVRNSNGTLTPVYDPRKPGSMDGF